MQEVIIKVLLPKNISFVRKSEVLHRHDHHPPAWSVLDMDLSHQNELVEDDEEKYSASHTELCSCSTTFLELTLPVMVCQMNTPVIKYAPRELLEEFAQRSRRSEHRICVVCVYQALYPNRTQGTVDAFFGASE